jgi:proline iminopeptidase
MLYGEIAPYDTGLLPVSDGFKIYYEQCGNPNGVPVVYLHGGPGAPSLWAFRQLFDPDYYRIIQFHQRGCGKSVPTGKLEGNTIANQLSDIQALKQHLNVAEPWVVFGNSWGSALALIYASKFPQDFKAMVLMAVSFADQRDADYFMEEGGASNTMPAMFATYKNHVAEDLPHFNGSIAKAYMHRFVNGSAQEAEQAAMVWAKWNRSILTLDTHEQAVGRALRNAKDALTLARMFSHYYNTEYSAGGRSHIWPHLEIIRQVPHVHIIHGRYDLICPAKNAWDLHKELPNSTLHMVPRAGHLILEGPILETTTAVMDALAKDLDA